MTAVDLDALDAARAAATAGPWATYTGKYGRAICSVMGRAPHVTDLEGISDADAALIVAAVNALPDLVADARELRALREAVEGLAEEYEMHGRQREAMGRPAWPLNVAKRLRALSAALTSEGGERE